MIRSIRLQLLCPHIGVLIAADGDTSTAEGFFGTAAHSYIVDQILPLRPLRRPKSIISLTWHRPALHM